MKKLFILLAMLSFTTFAMAQNTGTNHTKAYNESKQILEEVHVNIQNAKDCDELDLAVLGVLALFGVEDVDNITEAEEELLSKLATKIDNTLKEKKAKFNCPDPEDSTDDGQ